MGFYVCVLVQFKMELINKKYCVWNIEPHWPYYVYLMIHVYCSRIVGIFFLKFLNPKSTNTLNPKHTKSRSGHKLGSVRLRINLLNLPINQIRSGFKNLHLLSIEKPMLSGLTSFSNFWLEPLVLLGGLLTKSCYNFFAKIIFQ